MRAGRSRKGGRGRGRGGFEQEGVGGERGGGWSKILPLWFLFVVFNIMTHDNDAVVVQYDASALLYYIAPGTMSHTDDVTSIQDEWLQCSFRIRLYLRVYQESLQ